MRPTVQIRLSHGRKFSKHPFTVYVNEWTDRRSVDSRPRPKRSDSDISTHKLLQYTRIKTLTVTIPSGLKTSLTRPKVPQGNKSGAESPQKALLDYGKALPGYYSG